MRGRFGLLLIACVLGACHQQDTAPPGPRSPGRYAGIGTFDAGRLWQETKGAPTSQDPAAANSADDEHVIVVLDSHTGEIRQCGDHSGYCVAINPWTSGGTTAPVKLNKHGAELAAESDTSANKSSVKDHVVNGTASDH